MPEDPTIARGRQLIKEGKAKEAVLLYEQRIRDLNAQLSQKSVPPQQALVAKPAPPPPPPSPPSQTLHWNPLSVVVQQKAGPSCLKQLVIGCGALSVICIIGIVVFMVLSEAGKKVAEDEAADMNAGRGAIDRPIVASDWARFEEGLVRVTQMVRPANAQVEEFNSFNEDAPTGADYVLLWIEIECKQERCKPRFDIDLHLMDSAGKEWGEPTFMVLDDDLDEQEVLRGGTVAGWQVFEYPTGEEIKALRISWGLVDLHIELPTNSQATEGAG